MAPILNKVFPFLRWFLMSADTVALSCRDRSGARRTFPVRESADVPDDTGTDQARHFIAQALIESTGPDGVDRARAELKSHFLSKFAADVIRAGHPALAAKMQARTAVLDWRSRTLETIAAA